MLRFSYTAVVFAPALPVVGAIAAYGIPDRVEEAGASSGAGIVQLATWTFAFILFVSTIINAAAMRTAADKSGQRQLPPVLALAEVILVVVCTFWVAAVHANTGAMNEWDLALGVIIAGDSVFICVLARRFGRIVQRRP